MPNEVLTLPKTQAGDSHWGIQRGLLNEARVGCSSCFSTPPPPLFLEKCLFSLLFCLLQCLTSESHLNNLHLILTLFNSQNHFAFCSNCTDMFLCTFKANSPLQVSQFFTKSYKSVTWQSNDVKSEGECCPLRRRYVF